MLPELLHRETFCVRFFESEPTGRAGPGALCRFAHAAADGHCRTFGMSLSELRSENKMWILTRFQLQMERYPQNGDAVVVETWASSRPNGIRAVREFRFLDTDSLPLGRAAGIFLMMDVARRRPIRRPQGVLDIINAERNNPDEFEIPRLRAPQDPTSERKIKVSWRDLDANNHANNVSYIDWALEALPLERNRDRMLVQFDIEFLAEAFYGEDSSSIVEITEAACAPNSRARPERF